MYLNTPAVLWLGGTGGRALYRNTMRNRPTIRQPVSCNTVRVRAGRECVLGVLGARGRSGAGARRQQAAGAGGSDPRWRAGQTAAGARLGGRALGAGRTGRWAQARGACVAGGRQRARQ